jgi:hypothetical protein
MYTHARQFPHLAGRSDTEIIELARRGMIRRPHLIRIMRIRNATILIGIVVAAALLARFSRLQIGVILMMVGGISSAFIVLWN